MTLFGFLHLQVEDERHDDAVVALQDPDTELEKGKKSFLIKGLCFIQADIATRYHEGTALISHFFVSHS